MNAILWIPFMMILGALCGDLLFQDPMVGLAGGVLVGTLIYAQRRAAPARRE